MNGGADGARTHDSFRCSRSVHKVDILGLVVSVVRIFA
jgi:hypothetical protein